MHFFDIIKLTKLHFSLLLQAPSGRLVELATDYKKFIEYLPEQILKIDIIEKTDEYTITEETLLFKTIIKNKIIQRSKHMQINSNHLASEIISGPFEGSTINAVYNPLNSGTQVDVRAEIQIPIKYKILILIIKKVYKIWLTSILYKMNNIALGFTK